MRSLIPVGTSCHCGGLRCGVRGLVSPRCVCVCWRESGEASQTLNVEGGGGAGLWGGGATVSRARVGSGAAGARWAEGWSRARQRPASGHVVRAAGDLSACHLQRSGSCGGESLFSGPPFLRAAVLESVSLSLSSVFMSSLCQLSSSPLGDEGCSRNTSSSSNLISSRVMNLIGRRLSSDT